MPRSLSTFETWGATSQVSHSAVYSDAEGLNVLHSRVYVRTRAHVSVPLSRRPARRGDALALAPSPHGGPMTRATDKPLRRIVATDGLSTPLVLEVTARTCRLRPLRSRDATASVEITWSGIYERALITRALREGK